MAQSCEKTHEDVGRVDDNCDKCGRVSKRAKEEKHEHLLVERNVKVQVLQGTTRYLQIVTPLGFFFFGRGRRG